MDVVQAELVRILYHLDARAPGVFDERELEKAGSFARRRDNLDARRFEFLHLHVEVGEGETNVIDDASAARLRVRLLDKQEPRAAQHQSVRGFRVLARAEVL